MGVRVAPKCSLGGFGARRRQPRGLSWGASKRWLGSGIGRLGGILGGGGAFFVSAAAAAVGKPVYSAGLRFPQQHGEPRHGGQRARKGGNSLPLQGIPDRRRVLASRTLCRDGFLRRERPGGRAPPRAAYRGSGKHRGRFSHSSLSSTRDVPRNFALAFAFRRGGPHCRARGCHLGAPAPKRLSCRLCAVTARRRPRPPQGGVGKAWAGQVEQLKPTPASVSYAWGLRTASQPLSCAIMNPSLWLSPARNKAEVGQAPNHDAHFGHGRRPPCLGPGRQGRH